MRHNNAIKADSQKRRFASSWSQVNSFGLKEVHMRVALLLIGLFFSTHVLADQSEQLCNAGGYYAGAGDHFLSALSMRILIQRGDFGTAKCSALWQAAYRAGKRMSKSGKISSTADKEILDAATSFSSRVYASIAKGAGY